MNQTRLRFIHFNKGSLECLKLIVKFLDDLFFEILIADDLSNLLLPMLILLDSFLLIFFILRIFHAIMSEIESFSRFNDLSEPL